MGEYYGEPFQKLSKSPKNNMDEAEFIPKLNVKYLKRKKKKKNHYHQNIQENKENSSKKSCQKRIPGQFCQVLSTLTQNKIFINCYCLILKKQVKKNLLMQ